MTEYELIDAIASFNTSAVTALGVYLTLTSGYLVVAYLVGEKLTRSQVLIVSCLYLASASFFVFAITVWLQRSSEFVAELEALNPTRDFSNNLLIPIVVGGISALGIAACLKFMWDVRHPRD